MAQHHSIGAEDPPVGRLLQASQGVAGPTGQQLPHPQPLLAPPIPPPPLAPPRLPAMALPAAAVPQPQPYPPPAARPVYPITLQAMKQHKDHPLRMKLEWDEIHRARSIKEAIQSTGSLDDISDFWCAQYALICKDREGDVILENVLERVETMQIFRKRYEIAHSHQEGRRALRRFVTLCPNFILAYLYDPRNGNYIVVKNLANFSAENFSPEDVRDFMIGYYYFMLAIRPDFQSIHKGPDIKVECKDLGWSKRHNLKLIHKGGSEWASCFPFDICSGKFYNTRVGGAVFKMLLKPIISILTEPLGEHWPALKKIDLSLTYSDGLDSVLLVPDAATAQDRALRNIEESLRLRFENERRFSLSKDQANIPIICPYTDDEIEAVYDARRG